jgi:hypothetical protein
LTPNLRQTVKEHNELGLRAAPYMGYPGLGAPSQLSGQFGHEWSRRPTSTQPFEPPKGHYFWDVCARSGFADYMAAGTQWVLEDLGFYGCYTDGLAQVYPCQNTHHGYGYYDNRGILHSTWPLFATREMLKRMYRMIHARHPDGYLVNHVSFNTMIPSMAFTDVYSLCLAALQAFHSQQRVPSRRIHHLALYTPLKALPDSLDVLVDP